jgi:ABC-2 type transport system permease protein
MSGEKRNIKRISMTQTALGVAIIILVNIIGYFVFTRFDLTSEKRYTLSSTTKKMLRDLDDIVYFEVYLEGRFPAGFKRLKRETREMLDQFRAYSDNIQYEFINPSAASSEIERQEVYRRLVERGLRPTVDQVNDKGSSSQQVIFPGAIVTYKSAEMPMQLLVSQMGTPQEEVLNNSIQNLEFNLANTIKKLSVDLKPRVAFIEGHGELDQQLTADITMALKEYYVVDRVKINGQLSSLSERRRVDSASTRLENKYEALIIAKPDSSFDEKDKFILDQYIMRGGKVLWLIDPVFASMDSIQSSDRTVGIINDINLEDMLFNYGVRLNNNLVMDINALPIPLKTGQVGNAPQIDFFPWYYFPLITPVANHPIVKNLNVIKTEFISSIDTINTLGISKTILLTSGEYSRTVNTPAIISLDILRERPDRNLYNKKNIPVACLLEGEFPSLYNNRIPPEISSDSNIQFLPKSKRTRMIVVADGDVIKNQVKFSNGKLITYPLGYDRYTEQSFGNKEFILNAMNYLVDESGLIAIRSRELKLRLLDTSRIASARFFWQLFNTATPVILVTLFGIIMIVMRKRKYTRSRPD